MTSTIGLMLDAHPTRSAVFSHDTLSECLNACFECAAICTICADACLSEKEHLMHLTRCIRLNSKCAALCTATGQLLAHPSKTDTALLKAQLQVCQLVCRACEAECHQHASGMHMRHCAICAESCRRCTAACEELLTGLNTFPPHSETV